MPDHHDLIADLEAEIESLRDAAERCRKIARAAKAAFSLGVASLALALLSRKRARPGPQAIAAVILDEADLDVAHMAGEAMERHPGDSRLSPFDDAHEPLGLLGSEAPTAQHSPFHQFHE